MYKLLYMGFSMKLHPSAHDAPLPTSICTTLLRLTVLLLVVCFKAEAVMKLQPSALGIWIGDSIVDTGNIKTSLRSNFPPYGKDFEGGIPTGRFSNGKVPSDFIGIYILIPILLP